MTASSHPLRIGLTTFKSVLARYQDVVPEKLRDLDALRYDAIPAATLSAQDPSLTKAQLEKLVEWKLRHGKWRPKLQSLAASNAGADVSRATAAAASHLSSSSSSAAPAPPSPQDVAKALDAACALKGVGPATASLVLSCLRPDCVPFFADELFRWLCWDEPVAKGTAGWDRLIGYTKKEYGVLVERARALLDRLRREGGHGDDTDMLDLERVAYVLGKDGLDVGAGPINGAHQGASGLAEEVSAQDGSKKLSRRTPGRPQGTKRKKDSLAGNAEEPEESGNKRQRPTRSSARKK